MNFKQILKPWPLLIILTVAFLIRLYALINYGAFSWDEMFSFTYSQKPWLESLKFWTWETNPPLHMLILKLWWYIFPATEFWARLPSTIFGILSIYLIYKLGKIIFDQKIATYAALILSLFPLCIHFSATARGYALLIFLVIASTIIYYRIFVHNITQRSIFYLIFWSLINPLLIYVHLTSWIFIAAQFAGLFFVPNRNNNIKKFVLALIAPMALWLIWFVPSMINKISVTFFSESWFFNMPINYSQFIFFIQSPFVGYQFLPPLRNIFFHAVFIIGLLIIIGFCIWSTVILINKSKKENNKSAWPLIIMAYGPLIFAAAFKFWHIKFFAASVPFIILLTAYFLNNFFKKSWLIIFLILVILLPGNYLLLGNLGHNEWVALAKYIKNSSIPTDKKIFAYNRYIDKMTIERYLKFDDGTSMLGYRDPAYKNMNDDEIYVKQNYHFRKHSPEELTTWYKQNNLEKYNKIFLYSVLDNGVQLYKTLEQNGWWLEKITTWGTEDPRVLFEYVKTTNSTSTTLKN
ncbi:MAG: glycosyltransferase family 39 protein [Candidatus Magasanikbacteria bacterium]